MTNEDIKTIYIKIHGKPLKGTVGELRMNTFLEKIKNKQYWDKPKKLEDIK